MWSNVIYLFLGCFSLTLTFGKLFQGQGRIWTQIFSSLTCDAVLFFKVIEVWSCLLHLWFPESTLQIEMQLVNLFLVLVTPKVWYGAIQIWINDSKYELHTKLQESRLSNVPRWNFCSSCKTLKVQHQHWQTPDTLECHSLTELAADETGRQTEGRSNSF